MNTAHNKNLIAVALVSVLAFTGAVAHEADPLPSWNDGAAKKSIIDFVTKVTTAGSPDFVPVAERIAAFDNDGTLWCEQPVPVQFYFVADRVKALAPQHPEWTTKEPFASLLNGDVKGALEGGDRPGGRGSKSVRNLQRISFSRNSGFAQIGPKTNGRGLL